MSSLKDLLIDKYTAPELVEKLGIETEELLDYLMAYVVENQEVFEDDFEVGEELYE